MNYLKIEHEGKTFQFRTDAYSSLTAMCAAFGKRAPKFLELGSTEVFLAALSRQTGIPARASENPSQAWSENRTTLCQEKQPGNPTVEAALLVAVQAGDSSLQGTWAHPRLALKCAAWLSPDLEVWMMGVIQEVIKYGQPITGLSPEEIDRLLHRKWKSSRAGHIAEGAALLESTGLVTMAGFLESHPLSSADRLLLAREAARSARAAGEERVRVATPKGMRRAWSLPRLQKALGSVPPYLPGFES